MIAPVLIIGFKLDAVTVSIFVLATGVLLRIIYSKMKKDKSSTQSQLKILKTYIEQR